MLSVYLNSIRTLAALVSRFRTYFPFGFVLWQASYYAKRGIEPHLKAKTGSTHPKKSKKAKNQKLIAFGGPGEAKTKIVVAIAGAATATISATHVFGFVAPGTATTLTAVAARLKYGVSLC
jgi:hypothetical protein